MPPRTPLTIGVLGSGSTSRRLAATGLNEMIKGGKAKFILPVTEEHYSTAVKAVADYARRNEYPFEVIVDSSTEALDEVEDLLEEAGKTHKVTAVPRKLVSLLEAAGDKGRLALAWDDEDGDVSTALRMATEKSIPAFDMTQGMEEIELPDDGASATAEDEDADVPLTDISDDDEAEPEPARNPAVVDADEAQNRLGLEGSHKVGIGAMGIVEDFLNEIRRIVREEVSEVTKPRPRGRPRKDAAAR